MISAPVESRALIDIVWGTTLTNCSWSHIASHDEFESTGRVRRRFSYLIGTQSLLGVAVDAALVVLEDVVLVAEALDLRPDSERDEAVDRALVDDAQGGVTHSVLLAVVREAAGLPLVDVLHPELPLESREEGPGELLELAVRAVRLRWAPATAPARRRRAGRPRSRSGRGPASGAPGPGSSGRSSGRRASPRCPGPGRCRRRRRSGRRTRRRAGPGTRPRASRASSGARGGSSGRRRDRRRGKESGAAPGVAVVADLAADGERWSAGSAGSGPVSAARFGLTHVAGATGARSGAIPSAASRAGRRGAGLRAVRARPTTAPSRAGAGGRRRAVEPGLSPRTAPPMRPGRRSIAGR